MAQQLINLGTTPTGAGGDTPRSAFTKVNFNFTDLYAFLATLGSASTRFVGTSVGNVMEVGAFGLGSTSGGQSIAPNSAFTSGFYKYSASAAGAPNGSQGSLIVSSMGGNYIQQLSMSLPASLSNPYLGYRHFSAEGAPGPWCKIYHTGNTTIGSGGALSAASPVVRIADVEKSVRRDLLEQEFQSAGPWGAANGEASGVTVTRVDAGVYRIAGALGLAVEGWRIQDPCSPDGGRTLGITESEQDEQGVVTVRLFKQRWTLDEEGEMHLGKGAPLDVPLNSWIDVRLQMPAILPAEPPETPVA
ncbi:phage tail fiber protein [Pseudomonas sp. A014]|uniref:phage tail fiber protein n=1 Tax=Pseudomonas sp. A014 TaxID=3458058 RepID=UPI0040372BC9